MERIYLLRHGQASFGATNYDQLSDLGRRQAAVCGAVLPQAPLVSGTLLRHQQTATAAFPQMDVVMNADWNEFDYMDVIRAYRPSIDSHDALLRAMQSAHDPKRAFQQLYLAAIERWVSGHYDNDYAESRSAFCARVSRALAALQGKTVIVVTSGGPIAVVMQQLLSLSETATRQIEVGLVNAGISIVANTSAPRLITLNSYSHLEVHNERVTFR